MWKLFSARKKKASGGWSVLDSVLQLTATTQRKCCGWMNNKSRHWTPAQVKTYLVLFCLVFAGSSTWVLWRTFTGKGHAAVVSTARIPMLPRIPAGPEGMLTEKDITSIIEFKRFLDSLQTTPAGKQQYEQLQRARPGFLDSLAVLEQFLLNQ